MTQDEIIDMAIQAGASPDENKIWLMYAEEIETFANLVAAKAEAKEREACAKLVKDYMRETAIMEARGCLASVAYDIRARGEA